MLRCLFVALIALASASTLNGAPRSKTKAVTDDFVGEYRSIIPLGIQAYELHPERRPFYVMASATGADFDGWRVLGGDYHRYIVGRDGTRVSRYPNHIVFRVSAGARDRSLMSSRRDVVTSAYDMNRLLLGLQFRLKLFRGLQARAVKPQFVRQIGAPAETPLEERIYLVGFDLPDVPISDRMVLEVLEPDGERISKFHFDLY